MIEPLTGRAPALHRKPLREIGAPAERLRLFSPWTIGGFGVSVCFGLFLAFPHRSLEQRLAISELARKPDRLTVEYLKVFLKAEPHANGLRVSLVQQLLRLGQAAEARIALAPLYRAPELEWQVEAAWLELAILQQETYAEPKGSAARERGMSRLRSQLLTLMQLPQTNERLLRLADAALAAGEQGAAAAAYQALATRPGSQPAPSYANAAKVTLGLGDYRTSAALYLKAMEKSQRPAERRAYFLDALRTLQAGSLFDDALQAVDAHTDLVAGDTPLLMFVVRLALAANRPAVAERYARLMLRLSMRAPRFQTPMDYVLAQWLASASAPGIVRTAADVPDTALTSASTSTASPLPYDEDAYLLGYQVFLANRDLDAARKLAESAVRQRPDDPAWRRRLAEADEWSGRAQDALDQWLAEARLTGGEPAWDAVLRLGRSTYRLDALTEALRHKLAVDPGDERWLDELVRLYEQAGQPEQAIALVERALSRAGTSGNGGNGRNDRNRRQLELLANLTARVGHDADSLRTLETLQDRYGPDSGYALRIANRLYEQGKPREAYAALERAADAAPAGATAYWQAFAELARLLQDDPAAERGYGKLVESGKADADDIDKLSSLLEPSHPRAAAAVAEYGLAATGDLRFATRTLGLMLRLDDRIAAKRLLSRLDASQRAALAADADFLAGRATLRQEEGDLAGAERDLTAVLALRPRDPEARAAMIWVWIAGRRTQPLKRALHDWASDAESGAVLWAPFAAADMALNRPDAALHWFRKGGFAQDDPLWLMSYAECLDANARPDLAWRLRRAAWNRLRGPDALARIDPARWPELRARFASLAPLFTGGDRADSVVRALLRADTVPTAAAVATTDLPADGRALVERIARLQAPEHGAQRPAAAASMRTQLAAGGKRSGADDARLSAAVREVALAYALNRDANELARAWLATRFAKQLEHPLWAELSLLLAADDRAGLDRLLDDAAEWLPMADRIEGAQRAGRPALAQTLAFDQLARVPEDANLHQRLVALTTAEPPAVKFGFDAITQSPVRIDESTTSAGVRLSPSLDLVVGGTRRVQRSLDATILADVPRIDDRIEATLRRRTDTGSVSLSAQRRHALDDVTGLRLDYAGEAAPGLTLRASGGLRQPATESAPLRVGGVRSGAETELNLAVTSREYARAALGWQRYASQSGTGLGNGRTAEFELGSRFRIEYPDLLLRASASHGAYTASGRIDAGIARLVPAGVDPAAYAFLPATGTFYGLALGIGTAAESGYARAWRPFLETGVTYNPAAGRGVDYRGGVAGSVFGGDLLSLRAARTARSAGNPEGASEFGFSYQWFY